MRKREWDEESLDSLGSRSKKSLNFDDEFLNFEFHLMEKGEFPGAIRCCFGEKIVLRFETQSS